MRSALIPRSEKFSRIVLNRQATANTPNVSGVSKRARTMPSAKLAIRMVTLLAEPPGETPANPSTQVLFRRGYLPYRAPPRRRVMPPSLPATPREETFELAGGHVDGLGVSGVAGRVGPVIGSTSHLGPDFWLVSAARAGVRQAGSEGACPLAAC